MFAGLFAQDLPTLDLLLLMLDQVKFWNYKIISTRRFSSSSPRSSRVAKANFVRERTNCTTVYRFSGVTDHALRLSSNAYRQWPHGAIASEGYTTPLVISTTQVKIVLKINQGNQRQRKLPNTINLFGKSGLLKLQAHKTQSRRQRKRNKNNTKIETQSGHFRP